MKTKKDKVLEKEIVREMENIHNYAELKILLLKSEEGKKFWKSVALGQITTTVLFTVWRILHG